MKIFFLPNNIASMTAITVDAINKTGQHEARGLIFTNSNSMQTHLNLKVISFDKNSKSKYFLFLKWYYFFLKNLFWCDVIHWNGSFDIKLLKLTMPVIRIMKRPALVEFVGGERDAELEMEDNPYYKMAYYSGYEYPYESRKNSQIIQKLFSKAGFAGLALPGLFKHFSPQYFKRVYKCFQRIDTSKFNPVFPRIDCVKPLIIHSPSAPIGKGTKYVLAAIEKLKMNNNFEFVLVKNLPHEKALELVSSCDIFVDQLMTGHYGMAAMEAMAFGKPVVCFLKESVIKKELPDDVPVMSANPDNILAVLEKIIKDSNLRNSLGKQGREYVQKYHDIKQAVPLLIEIYRAEINNRNK